MHLVTLRKDGTAVSGAVVGDEVIDFSVAAPELPTEMRDLLEMGPEALRLASRAIDSGLGRSPLAEASLAAPVQPRKFFAIGLNYADHVAESGQPTPEHLTVFTKAVTSVVGPFDEIQRPAVSDHVDYEGELAFVIGQRCRHVSADRAAEVIAGYTIVNDVSVRDWQTMTQQWSLGKSFDTHGPIGPVIVTRDELLDPHALAIRTYVNGDLRQESNTEHLIFDCFDQIEVLSQACTLEPGDVIATGTPAGVAIGREDKPWLVPGDRVRVEIDGIGAIENVVVQEQISDDQFVTAALSQPS